MRPLLLPNDFARSQCRTNKGAAPRGALGQCLLNLNKLPHLSNVLQSHNIIHSTIMAQTYNKTFPPDHLLNLVNEQLLKPTYQERTSQLKNYFLGYKECSDTPPSPARSDPDQLFSYLEQTSENRSELPPVPPSRRILLQNLPEVNSHGKDKCSNFLFQS
jgi:hypothetical protein